MGRLRQSTEKIQELLDKVESNEFVTVDSALSTESENPVMNKVVTAELGEKANTSGRYPEMSVGFSDDLVGRGESVPAEYSFRASGGKSIKDGSARIKRLKGNSVVWNQKVKGFASWNLQGGTIEGNEAVWSAGNRTGALNAISNTFAQHTTHKYLISADVKASSTNVGLGIYYVASPLVRHTGSGNYESLAIITSGTGDGVDACYLTDVSTSGYGEIRAKNYRCIDLTLMFSAGNEPTTIEEYNARKPIVADEYAYNEGEVIHMTAEGIKSVGDNAWDEEWELGYINPGNGNESDSSSYIRSKNYCRIIGGEEYYLKNTTGGDGTDANVFIVLYDENHSYLDYWGIPEIGRTIQVDSRARYCKVSFRDTYGTTYKNDVLISLYHSGWKAEDAKYQPYWEDRLMFDKRIKDEFPDGMPKWDMVYNRNGKGYIVHGLGVEDMGDLNWYYDASLGGFYSDTLVGAKKLFDGICAKYPFVGDYRNVTDKTCGYVYELCVLVKDSSYTDAASLKTAMAGVLLYYQLAEPTVIEYDEPFNLDYRVADFGTEEIIAPQPSAPISADIIYQFNAVDMIREHELEITELQRIIATMQAQLTSLTSNNGGQ